MWEWIQKQLQEVDEDDDDDVMDLLDAAEALKRTSGVWLHGQANRHPKPIMSFLE